MHTEIAFAWALCAASVYLLIRHLSHALARPIKKSHSTVPAIKGLLAPPNMSLPDMLASRAIPNARLVKFFHLTNTFISADLEKHNAFRKRAVTLLHNMSRNGGWLRWAEVASQAVYIQSSSLDLPYDRFIQAITFRTVIVGLLNPGFDQTSFNRDDIDFITSTIITLWDHSKQSQPVPTSLLAQLKIKLRVYFPDEDLFPNPIDFIIPTWETLWRLVAATVANVHRNNQVCRAFLRFRNESNVETFRKWVDGEPSAEAVMTETLRLYPPTKRITRVLPKHREMKWPWSVLQRIPCIQSVDGCTQDVADIEAVQRSIVWSDLTIDTVHGTHTDTTTFNPARHKARTDAQSETLMAFGFGKLGCVAKEWAPMAAGLIVAAVLGEVDEAYEIKIGPKIGGRIGWDGWIIRTKNTQTNTLSKYDRE